jgi:broad specificity phosphatase PhoE
MAWDKKIILGTLVLLVFILVVRASWKSSPPATNPGLVNTTVLILRHAEKPDDGPKLSEQGVARAQAYAAYFTAANQQAGKPRIHYIFASSDSPQSERPRLTIEPTAQALGLKVDQRFRSKDTAELALELRRHRYGSKVLIVWHHGQIAHLLESLGGKPKHFWADERWPDDNFNHVLKLKFDEKGELISTTFEKIKLLPSD